ncbi:MAG: hypothetical protein K9G11_01330 [Rickettsiaceae bacterium]|nr:hypothetical protein [Rickettsiaceae bacterium]
MFNNINAYQSTEDVVKPITSKTIARIAAVQFYYATTISSDQSNDKFLDWLFSFHKKRHDYIMEDEELANDYPEQINKGFFQLLTNNITQYKTQIEDIIKKYLTSNKQWDHNNVVLISVIACGLCELNYIEGTPIKVVVNEFTNIAANMLSDQEIAFVNYVLDDYAKIIKNSRSLVNAL